MPETWGTYRRSMGAALGWHLFTNQSTAAAAASSSVLVCPDLIDTNLEANFLDTTWEYQPTGTNAGEVRRVVKAGLSPATGAITLSRAHTAATSSGTSVEFYGVLPPTQHLGRRGLLQAANLALQECWFIDHLSIPGVSTAYQYQLSTAYPWLDAEDQIVDVYVRRSGENRDALVNEWRFINDADTPQIEIKGPFSTSDTIKPVVYRPMDTWIEVNSSWADSITGLVNETDRALLSEIGMLTVGLYWCYEFLATEGDASQRAQWRSLADRQRVKANRWKANNLPQQDGRDVHWRRMAAGMGYGGLSVTALST